MCKIIFLGTGGGRINLIEQVRKTGGFLIHSKNMLISVDPGPGALLQMHSLGIDPKKIDCVICTHMHVDHVLDAPLLLEAMSGYTLRKGGILIASKQIIEGDEYGDRSIISYHQSKLEQNIIFSANDEREIKINGKGSFNLRGTGVRHNDESGFGFVMEIGGYKIGYTSDTEYVPSLHDAAFKGADVLIANCLKPSIDGIPDHLHSVDLAKLLGKSKPKTCIISHLGMKLIMAGPEQEAAKIESACGVKTIAARDGYFFELKSKKWGKYSKPFQKKDSQTRL